MHRRILPLLLILTPAAAHAVLVRGRVTTPLGVPLPGARVQLIQGRRSVGDAVSGADGNYEITTSFSGRFVLLTSRIRLIQIGQPFYAGRLDLITQDIALDPTSVTPQLSGGVPLDQLAEAPSQLEPTSLLTQAMVLRGLGPLEGSFILERGPIGSPATIYLHGADPAATQVRVDEVSAGDLGGAYNLGTLGTSGLAGPDSSPSVELFRRPGFPDAEAGTLVLATTLAETLHPTLTYAGDAGNLASVRNEAVLTATHTRADLLASFARFDTSNGSGPEAVPFHLASSAANAGYHISGNTSLRVTLRNDVAATALAPRFGIPLSGKDANQNLFAGATFQTATPSGWSNLLRYGLARQREQLLSFAASSAQVITITGANGTSITGLATLPTLAPGEDRATNRDEFTYETAYGFRPYLHVTGTARYQDERALDQLAPSTRFIVNRTHLLLAAAFTGDIRHRLFYNAAGFVDHSPVYGLKGAPQLGLTYAPVRPGTRRFHGFAGTTLHATAATGFREPSLAEVFGGPSTPRSRIFSAAIDQQIHPAKLSFSTTYFHQQFSHDYELLALPSATTLPNLSPTLAFRTQGVTLQGRYQPLHRIVLTSGYTYLASLVERSAGNGALSALPGARPFHRPPHTAFATAAYAGPRFSADLAAAFASRSDDTTALPQLLLPSRNLSPAWASVNASVSYSATRRLTVYTQLSNLANSRSIAPIGYHSAPFGIRTGLRFRLGSE